MASRDPSLVLILGDQLSPNISSLQAADKESDIVLMCEVADETTYVNHHKQKLVFILSAMRHFAECLRADGWQVEYIKLDDDGNSGSFDGEVERAIKRHEVKRLVITEAGEWRVQQKIDGWPEQFGIEVDCLEDDRFLCSKTEFSDWAGKRRSLTMEYFYRDMRRKTGLLMNGDEPVGGQWNFDKENRKPLGDSLFLPDRKRCGPDAVTRDVMELVSKRFPENFGALEPFDWAVGRAGALVALDDFLESASAEFGDYQDAMLSGKPYLYHSLLSAYINVGLLDPMEICRRVEAAYFEGDMPLNAAEGFIRQIIGWREYVRGVYWLKMPDYAGMNALNATRPLPWFYWSGETDMACIREVVQQTRETAYAHHIQRLMVTGTFALLLGVDPKELHEWYLAVYVDAFEWVELPNTIGMSQFADGGLLGSKPYAASGAYIDRMSDYCSGCQYDVKARTGEKACPFNALYWDFINRNRDRLKSNGRMRNIYATWERMDAKKRDELLETARLFVSSLG